MLKDQLALIVQAGLAPPPTPVPSQGAPEPVTPPNNGTTAAASHVPTPPAMPPTMLAAPAPVYRGAMRRGTGGGAPSTAPARGNDFMSVLKNELGEAGASLRKVCARLPVLFNFFFFVVVVAVGGLEGWRDDFSFCVAVAPFSSSSFACFSAPWQLRHLPWDCHKYSPLITPSLPPNLPVERRRTRSVLPAGRRCGGTRSGRGLPRRRT